MKVMLLNKQRTIPINRESTFLRKNPSGKKDLVGVSSDIPNFLFGTIVHGQGDNYSLFPRYGNIYVNGAYAYKRIFLHHGDYISFNHMGRTERYTFLIREDDYVPQREENHPIASKDLPVTHTLPV